GWTVMASPDLAMATAWAKLAKALTPLAPSAGTTNRAVGTVRSSSASRDGRRRIVVATWCRPDAVMPNHCRSHCCQENRVMYHLAEKSVEHQGEGPAPSPGAGGREIGSGRPLDLDTLLVRGQGERELGPVDRELCPKGNALERAGDDIGRAGAVHAQDG